MTKSSPPLPDCIGKYRVVGYLASGSFGTVYEGYYTILEQRRRVAIKTLKSTAAQDAAGALRFREEVKTLCLLDHPNVCKVIDGGIEDGLMYLVMDFAEGGSLKAMLKQSAAGRIDWRQAAVWLREAASGMLAAESHRDADGQEAPIYHRDIKPENLLLKQGRVVVADFGAAKLGGSNDDITSESVPAVWTPNYGSPEQQHGSVDHRSDIYSLGATFFYLLTGEVTGARFDNRNDRFSEAHDPSRRVRGIPRQFGEIIRKMTEPKALMRQQSFADVLADLDAFERPRSGRWVAAAAVLLIAAGAAAWFALDRGMTDPDGRTLAEWRADVAAVERQLQSPPLADWSDLEACKQQWQQVVEAVAKDRAALDRLAAAGLGDADRPRLPEEFVAIAGPGGLASRLEQVTLRAQAQAPLRDGLRSLRERVAAQSTERSRREIAELDQEADRVQPDSGLRTSLQSLKDAVRDATTAREARVDGLVGALRRNEFAAIANDGKAVREELAALGEDELVRRVDRIVEAAATATGAQAAAPMWPTGAASAWRDLDGLEQALLTLDERDPQSRFAELGAWWSSFAAARRSGWADALAQAGADELAGLKQRIEKVNAAIAASPSPSDELSRQRAEVEAAIAEWREASDRIRPFLGRGLDAKRLTALLRETLPKLSELATTAAADLQRYRDNLAKKPPDAPDDPALAAPHEALVAAFRKLAEALQSPATKQGLPSALTALAQADQGLESARVAYDGAQKTWRRLAKARELAAKTAVSALRADCAKDAYTESYAALETVRSEVAAAVERIAAERAASVERLRADLRGGEPRPARLVEAARKVAATMTQCGEDELAAAATTVATAAQQADERLAALSTSAVAWRAGDSDDAAFAATAGYAATQRAVAAVAVPEGSLLAEWLRNRRRALVEEWLVGAEAHWTAVHAALERGIAAVAGAAEGDPARAALETRRRDAEAARSDLVAFAAGLGIAGDGRSWGMPLKAVPAAVVSAIEYPEGWPDRAFAPPAGILSLALRIGDAECQRLYAADFLADAEARGLRLWHLPERRGHDGQPVYMAFCLSADGAEAALVDVHPVTLGELRQKRDARQVTSYWRPGFDTAAAATMAYDTSANIANRLVTILRDRLAAGPAAAAAAGLTLPPPGYRAWPVCLPRGARPAPSGQFPLAQTPLGDVAANGLAYVQSGVREWLADGTYAGESDIPASAKDGVTRRDTGFRLALVLKR